MVSLAEQRWGARLVETAVWVHHNPLDNRVMISTGRYLNTSKSDLLIFRRTHYKRGSAKALNFPLELRHQRTPDVCLMPMRCGGRCPRPTPRSRAGATARPIRS